MRFYVIFFLINDDDMSIQCLNEHLIYFIYNINIFESLLMAF